jgi:hypothetical protein
MLLGNMGRPVEALDRAKKAEASVGKQYPGLTPWGQRLEICAAADLGERVFADQQMTSLLRSNGSAWFKVQALICLDRLDEAASVASAALQRRSSLTLLRRLQREPGARWGIWHQRWDKGFAALRERPDVQAAMRGYGTVRVIGFADIENL